ncbi:MAG: ATP-binding protein [Planctomycetota bacterium]|nr:MAG: ATP-binding protein [Planctomycetota bacterium]
MSNKIRRRERTAIIQSLQAGVVPRVGLQHIQVGRLEEVEAVLRDLENIKEGGASIRFIIGRFGSGKSFFLNLARIVALEQKFVVVQADITLERRLHASDGKARNLYSELMQNMATRSKPAGGALASVIERWVSDIDYSVRDSGGDEEDVSDAIHEKLKPLQEYVSGYDFAEVISRYVEGFHKSDDQLVSSAIRWLKGEYGTKTEARQDLGVRSVITDKNIYDYLKLMGRFIQLAGYNGLLVNIDEMGVLSHRLNHSTSRNNNYEKLLAIVNDCLQGNVTGIGFIFAGTDAFLEDKRRGLYSYEALATRLAENTFAVDGLKDFSSPIIRLENLSPEDLFVLLCNIRSVFASDDSGKHIVPDDALKAFMQHCSNTLGAAFYRTPRDTVKSFVGLLSVLEQNPGADWRNLLKGVTIKSDPTPESGENTCPTDGDSDDLAKFQL